MKQIIRSLGVGDVRARSACGYGVNHRPAIAVASRVGLGGIKGREVLPNTLRCAPANSGKAYSVIQAIQFMGGWLLVHFCTLFASSFCLANRVQIGRGKEAKRP